MINATEQMKELIELGCKFAIDDFGAGYSSFDYLKSLPVHYIKIDGAFIRNVCTDVIDQTIVRSICEIAKASGKQTIAEYVQDDLTLELLGELGVDYAQGFHIGKPSPRLRRRSVSITRTRAGANRKQAG
jgi:EAL domain-containing protein (putative c-di-GMP-specific phosphodiesterase class I)